MRVVTSGFMNPPYSCPKPFIEKAWDDSRYCRIVCLVKCDPSTKWWGTFWDYGLGLKHYNGAKQGCQVRFFPKRIKFDPPKNVIECICVRHLTAAGPHEIDNTLRCGWCVGTGLLDETYRILVTDICSVCKGNGIIYKYQSESYSCIGCKGAGNHGHYWSDKKLSGPTFSSALVIMDRRGL